MDRHNSLSFGSQKISTRTQCHFVTIMDFIFAGIILTTHIAALSKGAEERTALPFIFICTSSANLILAGLLFIGVQKTHLQKCQLYMFGSALTILTDGVAFILFIIWKSRVNSPAIFIILVICHCITFIYKSFSFVSVRAHILSIIREKASQLHNSSFNSHKRRDSEEKLDSAGGLTVQNNYNGHSLNSSPRSPKMGMNIPIVPHGGHSHGQTGTVGRRGMRRDSEFCVHGIEDLLHQVEFPTESQVSSDQFQIGETLLKREPDFYVKDGRLELSVGKFTPVAIKIFRQNADVEAVRRMLLETKILTSFRNHNNIIQLLGFCTENIHKGKLVLLTELCAKGNLEDFLKDNYEHFQDMIHEDQFKLPVDPSNANKSDENIYQNILTKQPTEGGFTFNSKTLLNWAFQLSNGMEFITRNGVVHGNLLARHCLIDDRNRLKIANFTFATQLYHCRETEKPINFTRVELNWRWMAVECMTTDPPEEHYFTEKSDIWSYGVTLWEIFSLGCVPYDGQATSEFYPKLLSGYRLEKPPFATNHVYGLLLKCWQSNPEERPTFSEIKAEFGEILQSLMG